MLSFPFFFTVCLRGAGQGREEEGPGLRGLSGVEVEVKAEDVHRDKDFNLADLDKCTVKMCDCCNVVMCNFGLFSWVQYSTVAVVKGCCCTVVMRAPTIVKAGSDGARRVIEDYSSSSGQNWLLYPCVDVVMDRATGTLWPCQIGIAQE